MGDPRRVTQELVEVEYTPDSTNRRVTQLLVEIEYLAVPDEDQTQIRGWDQIQPWSITSDRLSAEVAGAGLRGGGAGGPLWVDADIYPPPTAQGEALVADGTPQWTPTLTPTWLGEHTFNAGLVIAAAQAITMGEVAYIGIGAADMRLVFYGGDRLEVIGAAADSTELRLSNAGTKGARLKLNEGAISWRLQADAEEDGTNSFVIRDDGVSAIRLYIDNAGYVGIGTDVPDRLFHAEVADAATNAVSYAQRLSHLTSNTAITGFGVGLEFELEENDGTSKVAAIIETKWSDAGEGANADGYLDFLTMLDDGAAASRMVVGYNGFVGIGITAPLAPLHVYAAGDTEVRLEAAGVNSLARLAFFNDQGDMWRCGLRGDFSDSFVWDANPGGIGVWSQVVAITTAGLFGIATVSPDRLLHVEVADAATNTVTYAQRLTHITSNTAVAGFGVGVEFELEENDATNKVAAIIEVGWDDAGEGANADAYIDFKTMLNDGASDSRMMIGQDGNVRVGAPGAQPDHLLEIYQNDVANTFPSIITLKLTNSDSAAFGRIQSICFGYTDLVGAGIAGVYDNWDAGNGGGHILAFYTKDSATEAAPTEKMRLNKYGYLGIGTGSTVDRLLHSEVSDSATNSVAYAQRLSHITDQTVVAGFGTGIEFELEENDGSNKVAAIIEAKWSDAGEGTTAHAFLDFLTMHSDGAAASRMVVGWNGLVGIGTSTPSTLVDIVDGDLRVRSAGAATRAVIIDAAAAQDSYLLLRGGTSERVLLRREATSNNFQISTDQGASWGFTMEPSGDVGIGTTGPENLLHLWGSNANTLNYLLKLSHGDGTNPGTAAGILFSENAIDANRGKGGLVYEADGTGWGHGKFHFLQNSVANTAIATLADAVVTIDNVGNVGLGTTTPFGPFHATDSPGSGMFVTADDVDNVGTTIVPNAAGDVTSGLTALYRVLESAGGVSGGSATVDNNSSVDLYDDGTDILTLAVAADGSVTLQRTAGAASFDVSLWMVWL